MMMRSSRKRCTPSSHSSVRSGVQSGGEHAACHSARSAPLPKGHDGVAAASSPSISISHEPSAISAAEGGQRPLIFLRRRNASATPSPPMAAFSPVGRDIFSFSIQHSAISFQHSALKKQLAVRQPPPAIAPEGRDLVAKDGVLRTKCDPIVTACK